MVHAREEIRDGQALDVDAEDLTGQRRPAQQAGILVHVPGTHLADLVGHAQLGVAGAQFLAQAVLVAGGAAQADIHRGKQRPVQQVDPDRGLHIRPPGRQHIAPAQAGVDRQRVLGQRAQAGNALDAIHGTGLGAQRGQCVAAQQLAFGQPEATPRHGAGIRAARQHVAMRVGDRDHPGIAGIHAADDGLQFRRAQPCQQPAVTAHRQRQRQDPVRGIQRLRRPEENLAAQAAIAIHRPQRQLQVAAATGQGPPVLVDHHDAVQFGLPLQGPGDAGIEQVRCLRRHPLEEQRAIAGDALHHPLQVAQFQPQQALGAGGQRRALALRGFLPSLAVIEQRRHQPGAQQHAQGYPEPHERPQWPCQGTVQRGHRNPFPERQADFICKRFLVSPNLSGRCPGFLTPSSSHGRQPAPAESVQAPACTSAYGTGSTAAGVHIGEPGRPAHPVPDAAEAGITARPVRD